MAAAADAIDAWLRALPAEAQAWLAEACARIAGRDDRALYIAFGQAPRHVGRGPLPGGDGPQALAAAAPGVDATCWTADQAARARLVLALPADDAETWLATLDRLFAAAGLQELIALYQALPLLPNAGRLAARAAEGVRSNMKAVFEAVALGNPYPSTHLDEAAWNQLVLKCLFVGSPLRRVSGLDQRANPRLARMLVDYAHERWAAKRPVAAELWRAVGRHADPAALDDLARLLAEGDEDERRAAALALHAHGSASARARLTSAPDLAQAAASGALTWDQVGRGSAG